MMKTLLLGTTLAVFQLLAAEECDLSASNKVELMQCLDQQLERVKRELTTWENNHLFQLEKQSTETGRQDGLKLFNKSRQTFNLYIEQDCRWQFISQLPNSNKASAQYKQCQLAHLKQRVEFLKQLPTKPE